MPARGLSERLFVATRPFHPLNLDRYRTRAVSHSHSPVDPSHCITVLTDSHVFRIVSAPSTTLFQDAIHSQARSTAALVAARRRARLLPALLPHHCSSRADSHPPRRRDSVSCCSTSWCSARQLPSRARCRRCCSSCRAFRSRSMDRRGQEQYRSTWRKHRSLANERGRTDGCSPSKTWQRKGRHCQCC